MAISMVMVMPRPWTLSDLDSDSESDIPTQTRQRFSPKTKKKERKIEKPSSRSSEKLLVETVGRQIMHAVAALRFSLSASFLLFGKL